MVRQRNGGILIVGDAFFEDGEGMRSEAGVSGDACWRRLMLGAEAAWNVDCLMLGGVVTRSWEMERLSKECGLRCAGILEIKHYSFNFAPCLIHSLIIL